MSRIRTSAGYRAFTIANTAFLVLLCVVTIYPFVHVASIAFSTYPEAIRTGLHLYPREVDLSSVKKVFAAPEIWTAYYNTVWRTVIGTVLSVLVTGMGAYVRRPCQLPAKRIHNRDTITATLDAFWAGRPPSGTSISVKSNLPHVIEELVELSATNDAEIQRSFGKMLQRCSRCASRIISLASGRRVSDRLVSLTDVVPIVRAAVRGRVLLESPCHANYTVVVVTAHPHQVLAFAQPEVPIGPIASDLRWLGRWYACQCFGKGCGNLLSVLRHASVPQRDDTLHQPFLCCGPPRANSNRSRPASPHRPPDASTESGRVPRITG